MSVRDEDPGITGWVDRMGGLIERFPGAAIGIGNLESRVLRDEIEQTPIDRPIYITSLARSGSTILLELLADHGDVATHRYRDFPPVMAPRAWNWFVDRAGPGEGEARERAHKDRIAVTPESPEAFEEVIWMAFFRGLHDPESSAVLCAQESHPAFETFYRDHIRKLLRLRGGARYLAKANYNITRLGYLLRLFPDARFLVPVRDPVWHVASLMKQHRLFLEQAGKDPRVVDHLRRTGHFEFGPDRRAINAGDGAATQGVAALWAQGRDVEGWAEYWALVYGHLADRLDADPALASAVRLVRYETLCERPGEEMRAILDHCGLAPGAIPEVAAARISRPDYYSPDFSAAERVAIGERTAATAQRLGLAS